MSTFTPRRIAEWRATVNQSVESALDQCEKRGQIDIMDDFGGVVSAGVMGEILGLRIDRHKELVDALAQAFPSDPELIDHVPTGFARICEYAGCPKHRC